MGDVSGVLQIFHFTSTPKKHPLQTHLRKRGEWTANGEKRATAPSRGPGGGRTKKAVQTTNVQNTHTHAARQLKAASFAHLSAKCGVVCSSVCFVVCSTTEHCTRVLFSISQADCAFVAWLATSPAL